MCGELIYIPTMEYSEEQCAVREAIRTSKRHVLVVGPAGSGKTVATQGLKGATFSHAKAMATLRDPQGMTLMSLLGLTPKLAETFQFDARLLARKACGRNKVRLYSHCKLWFIEEVATIPLYLMQTLVHLLELLNVRTVRLIMSGDLYQLGPVNPNRTAHDDFFLFDKCLVRALNPLVFRFKANQRTSDPDLQSILHAARYGSISATHLRLLQTRMDEAPPEDCIHLVGTWKKARKINKASMKGVPENIYVSHATKPSAAPEDLKKLALHQGMRVLFTQDDSPRYYKGLLGEIAAIRAHSLEGKATDFAVDVTTGEGERITVKARTVAKGCKQLPFVCAAAVVIHRTQGMTLDEMAVDLKGLFANGQVYTALSRARSLGSIYITGMDEETISRPGALVDTRLVHLDRDLDQGRFPCACGETCIQY